MSRFKDAGKFHEGDDVLIISYCGWGRTRNYIRDSIKKVHAGNGNVTTEKYGRVFRQDGSELGRSRMRDTLEPFEQATVDEIDAEKLEQEKLTKLRSLGDIFRGCRNSQEGATLWDRLPECLQQMVELERKGQ